MFAGYSFGASATELRGGRERNGRRQTRLSYGVALRDPRRRSGCDQSAAEAGRPAGSRTGLSETDGPGPGHTQGRPVNRRDAAPSRRVAISYDWSRDIILLAYDRIAWHPKDVACRIFARWYIDAVPRHLTLLSPTFAIALIDSPPWFILSAKTVDDVSIAVINLI